MTAKLQPSEPENFADLDVAAVFAKPFRPLKLADDINEVVINRKLKDDELQ